jgi:outer membrane protein assembly factor BamB
MANHHGGIVRVGDHMYGFGNGGLICMDFAGGEIVWRNRSVSKGSLCYADGRLYCFGEKNQMALVEANPAEYVETGRFDLPQREYPTWAHPGVANGRMYLRDQNILICYDVRAK